jgi:uncharacterized zinc-type alcohol dehydrogenase-like protein
MRPQPHRYYAQELLHGHLRHWNVKKGDKVGVVGLEDCHMGVKFANALGAHVWLQHLRKGKDAKRLGAHEVLISKDEDGMKTPK